jgi:hypothetical protein
MAKLEEVRKIIPDAKELPDGRFYSKKHDVTFGKNLENWFSVSYLRENSVALGNGPSARQAYTAMKKKLKKQIDDYTAVLNQLP